jgi:hypothetical protein
MRQSSLGGLAPADLTNVGNREPTIAIAIGIIVGSAQPTTTAAAGCLTGPPGWFQTGMRAS